MTDSIFNKINLNLLLLKLNKDDTPPNKEVIDRSLHWMNNNSWINQYNNEIDVDVLGGVALYLHESIENNWQVWISFMNSGHDTIVISNLIGEISHYNLDEAGILEMKNFLNSEDVLSVNRSLINNNQVLYGVDK